VSWFEAAAYAEYAGKSLPPLPHWKNAASMGKVQAIVPFSNFSGTAASVGHFKGIWGEQLVIHQGRGVVAYQRLPHSVEGE